MGCYKFSVREATNQIILCYMYLHWLSLYLYFLHKQFCLQTSGLIGDFLWSYE